MLIVISLVMLIPILSASAVLSPSATLLDEGPHINDKEYDVWQIFGSSNKQTALTDGDETTGIFSLFNNDVQTFFVDVPLTPDTLEIPSITLSADHKKGETFSGQSRFSFYLFDSVSGDVEKLDTFATSTGIKTDFVVLTENPITGQPWTVGTLKTMTFGFIQDTDNKPIHISEFDVIFDVPDSTGPVFADPAPPPVVLDSSTNPDGIILTEEAFCYEQDENGFFTTTINPLADQANCIPVPDVSDDTSITVTISDSLTDPTIPVGDIVLTWTACDFVGNCTTITQTISNPDTVPPILSIPPGPFVNEANVPNGFQGDATTPAYDIVLVTATDNVDPNPIISCDLQPDSFYTYIAPNPTDTLVTCTATDASGNVSAPGIFVITVQDTIAPVVSVSENTVHEGNVSNGYRSTTTPAYLDSDISITDTVDPNPNISCDHLSGDFYPHYEVICLEISILIMK
jgi:hypothetical protein